MIAPHNSTSTNNSVTKQQEYNTREQKQFLKFILLLIFKLYDYEEKLFFDGSRFSFNADSLHQRR
jgi:hypothetical protein